MVKHHLIFSVLSAGLSTALSLSAQEPGQSDMFPLSHQISDPRVTCFAEDGYGFVWIGTRHGLNRFSGSTYVPYLAGKDSLSLSGDAINALLEDGDKIWIGNEHGIEMISYGNVRRKAPAVDNVVNCIAGLDSSTLVVSNVDGIALYDKESGRTLKSYEQREVALTTHIALSPDGMIWASGRKGVPFIFIFDKNLDLRHTIPFPEGSRINGISSMGGLMYIATDQGLCRFDPGSRERVPLDQPFAKAEALFASPSKDGTEMAVGYAGEGIYMTDGRSWEHIWTEETLSGEGQEVCYLSSGNIWISNGHRGFFYEVLDSDVKTYHLPGSESIIGFFPTGENGRIIATGTKNIHLFSLDSEKHQDITPSDIRPDQVITAAIFDPIYSYLWLTLSDGILRRYYFSGGELSAQEEHNFARAHCLWVGKDGSLNMIHENDHLTIDPTSALSRVPMGEGQDFWYSYTSPSGKTYLYGPYGIAVAEPKGGIRWIVHGSIPYVTCLMEDRSGRLWAGSSSDGLFRIEDEKITLHLSEETGLPDNTCRSLVQDGFGDIWIATRYQVVRFNPDNLRTIAYDQSRSKDFIFGRASSTLLGDGSLLFGGTGLLLRLRPEKKTAPNATSAIIEGVFINGEKHPREDLIKLPHDRNQVDFYYSSINFDQRSGFQYRYMLEGYDKDWVKASPSQRAGYSRLPAGKYSFSVQVLSSDGIVLGESTKIGLKIRPAPWASVPAMIGYLLLLFLITYVIYRYMFSLRIQEERAEMADQNRRITEKLSQDKETFFMNISHEYRTPLSLIWGPAQELSRSEGLSPKQKEWVGLISRNASRMLDLTEQILRFDKIGHRTDALRVKREDLGEMVGSIVSNFSFIFEKKHITDKVSLPERSSLYCDSEKVEKILSNLLSNAAKYTKENGLVEVEASILRNDHVRHLYSAIPESDYKGDWVEISVKDNGVGIPKEKMERIFDRYERLHDNDLNTGFGLGLNFARELARKHKGDIKVEARHPEGTRFSFVIPSGKEAYSEKEVWEVTLPQEPLPDLPDRPAESHDKDDVTILLAEDDEDMRSYLKSLLEESFTVIATSDGQQAAEQLRLSMPDIVVSDIVMPYVDGFTLCRQIKDDPATSHIPVVLLTAKDSRRNHLEGLGAGADAYVPKPFHPDILMATVRNLILGRRRMQSILAGRTSSSPKESNETLTTEVKLSTHDRKFIERMYRIIDENISDENFNVSSVAHEMGMSRSTFHDKCKALLGESPQTFLQTYRLNRAMELLQEHDRNISEVSYAVGFSSLSGFSRSFKRKFGIPPSGV